MPTLKDPTSLLALAIYNIRFIIRDEALRVSHLVDTIFNYEEIEGKNTDRKIKTKFYLD